MVQIAQQGVHCIEHYIDIIGFFVRGIGFVGNANSEKETRLVILLQTLSTHEPMR